MKRAPIISCLLVALAGCTPQRTDYESNSATLESFPSAAALTAYFKQNASGTELPNPMAWLGGSPGLGLYVPQYTPGSALPYDPTYTFIGGLAGTSMQDLWASEMDTARMQGEYLYVLDDYGLSIVRAVPADQMEIVGRFTILTPSVSRMYLVDAQKAVVLTQSGYASYYPGDPSADRWLPDGTEYFDVYVVDLNDPATPAALAHYSFQGIPVTARVVGGDRFAAMSANCLDQPYYGSGPVDLSRMTLDQILPLYRVIDAHGNESIKPLLEWQAVRRPANPDGDAVLTVLTIDLARPGSPPAAIGMLGYWETAYATPTSLYLTNTPQLPGAAAPASQPFTAPAYSTTTQPSTAPAYRTTTEIHRFDITGLTPRYAGSIKLNGRPAMYNAFYEDAGLLRTAMANWNGNLLDLIITGYVYYALKPTDNGLEIAARIKNMIQDFIPYYVNIVGDLAVIAGYKGDGADSAPMLVDMADPIQPKVLGEASLPVDWASMYKLDAAHILAMGSEPNDTSDPYNYSWTYSISIYDITQPLNPTLAHRVEVGQGITTSSATSNSQEMYLADGLLVIPVDLYEGSIPDNAGLESFSGLYAYRLSLDKGIELLGQVETATPYRYVNWHRAFVRDGILYAVTNAGVKAVSLDNMEVVLSSVRLPE